MTKDEEIARATTINAEHARMNFSMLLAYCRYMRHAFVIERHGHRMALVIPLDDAPAEPERLPENCKEFALVKKRA